MSVQARNYYYEKVPVFLIVTLWIKLWEIEYYFRRSIFALVLNFLVRMFRYFDWIRNADKSANLLMQKSPIS